MVDAQGLISAYLLDGHGKGRECGWAEVRSWQAGQGTLWAHLDRLDPMSQRWLREESWSGSAACASRGRRSTTSIA